MAWAFPPHLDAQRRCSVAPLPTTPVALIVVAMLSCCAPEPADELQPAVAGLPYSEGQIFLSLDQYLAHLKVRGAYDVPFYEEVEPDVFELRGGRRSFLAEEPERFTRAELEQKFGFVE